LAPPGMCLLPRPIYAYSSCIPARFGNVAGTLPDVFNTDLAGYLKFDPTPQLPCGISMTATWVPWYDILLFFLRVGLTKIWELGTDPIAIRSRTVLDGPV
jgi:hypothetical protein